MSKIYADLLVFDLDGTLIDSKKDIANAFNEVLRQLGRPPFPDDEIAKYIGIGVQSLLKEVFDSGDPDKFSSVLLSFAEAYGKHLLEHTKVYEGIFEVLQHFQSRPKVVLTNKRQKFADPSVEKLGLVSYFEGVYGREYFPTSKPDPGPLFEISKRFGVPLSRMVLIGDTDIDVQTAKRAGVKSAVALYGYGNREALIAMEPDALVEAPLDLIKVIT